MSKSLVLGNGNILVGLNEFAQVQDFYFPHIGQENQIGNVNDHRIGVMVGDSFSWIGDGTWEISIQYQTETLVSDIKARNNHLGIEINFADTVYNEKNIFLRKITVKNLKDYPITAKLFLAQHFQIYATPKRDTAYYEPRRKVIIHYEGRRVFVVGGKYKGKSFDSYSVGLMGIEGKEGTWRDAEDGRLERNAIEHGSVDSVIQFNLSLGAQEEEVVDYWIAVAKTFKEAFILHDYVVKKTATYLIQSTYNFWQVWVNKTNINFSDLPKNVVDLFKRSLLIMRTHIDNNGAILASGDSDMLQNGRDTYAYVWLRDAAFIAMAMDKAKHFDLTHKFFQFCQHTISEEGYFFHKYRSDESIGSSWLPWVKKGGETQLAIQEDETALVLYALWHHYEQSLDLEFIENLYYPLIKKAADFMCDYIDAKTGLPQGSYDIWEEKFGTSTFSSSSVFAGLTAASKLAKLLGKTKDREKYQKKAQKMQKAILKFMYNKKEKYFYRYVKIEEGYFKYFNRTIDASSFLGLFRFNVLEADSQELKEMEITARDNLTVKTKIGGIARYQGDKYYQVEGSGLSNPWFITTLSFVQYKLAIAKNKQDLQEVKKWLQWTVKHALPSGILAEQINAQTGEQLSAAPLTWSHAEFVLTVFQFLEKIKEFNNK